MVDAAQNAQEKDLWLNQVKVETGNSEFGYPSFLSKHLIRKLYRATTCHQSGGFTCIYICMVIYIYMYGNIYIHIYIYVW